MLCKFSPPNKYGLSNLENCHFLCRHFADFNDPFEFWSKFNFRKGAPNREKEPDRFLAAIKTWGLPETELDNIDDDSTREYFEEMSEQESIFSPAFDKMRISCFSSDPANLLLWSHYADGLRGYCAIFDPEMVCTESDTTSLVDVAYANAPPEIDSFLYAISVDQLDYHLMAIDEAEAAARLGDSSEEARYLLSDYRDAADDAHEQILAMWKRAYATEPKEWMYEKEQRLLVLSEGEGPEPIFYNYPKNALKEVVVGERMPANYKKSLIKVLSNNYENVRIRTAVRARNYYSIQVV